jgi:hypothetical protein
MAVEHIINRGLTRHSASILAWFGVILCGAMADFQWGKANMEFVYSLLPRFQNQSIECRVTTILTLNVAHWTVPVYDLTKRFIEAYNVGMQTCDLVTAFWAAYFYHEDAFCSGKRLQLIAHDAEVYSKQMIDYGMLNHLKNLESIREAISQLQGLTDVNVVVKKEGSVNKGLLNHLSHHTKDRLRVLSFFGQWDQCAELGMTHVELINKVLMGQYASVVSRFITSLACFVMVRRDRVARRKYLPVAMKNLYFIRTWCAKGNPNTQHYLALLKAEKADCNGKAEKASSLYKQAILLAGRCGCIHDQAMASERHASFYLRTGDAVSAKYCLEDAKKLYGEWGAAKKVEMLVEQISSLK